MVLLVTFLYLRMNYQVMIYDVVEGLRNQFSIPTILIGIDSSYRFVKTSIGAKTPLFGRNGISSVITREGDFKSCVRKSVQIMYETDIDVHSVPHRS